MTEPDRLTSQLFFERDAMRPTAITWLKHIFLLGVTFCTATIAGSLYPFGPIDTLPDADPANFTDFISMLAAVPFKYGSLLADAVGRIWNDPATLAHGTEFSLSLLFILVCHEMGHYVACRLYRVDATLPFFIPTPPMIGPAGTFGAFIKILSPMPSRRAIFDIGVAGPIAGFLALIPIAAIGVATMQPATTAELANVGGLTFSDPLFMKLLGSAFGKDPSMSVGNAFYFAAWVGLLVTALNLIPSGQLDGGHAIFAVFGERVHRWTGRIAFVVMTTLSICGLIFFGSPSGFLIAVILAIMMRVGHPVPWDQTALGAKRNIIAIATLIIFVLCFLPFPIQIN